MPKKMTQAKKKSLKQKIKTHLHNTHFLTIFNTKKVSANKYTIISIFDYFKHTIKTNNQPLAYIHIYTPLAYIHKSFCAL